MTMVDGGARARLMEAGAMMAMQAVASVALQAMWDQGVAAVRAEAARVRAAAAARQLRAVVQGRLIDEGMRVRAMLDRAVPPPEMAAAPIAPARGPMRLVSGMVESEYAYDRRRAILLREHSTYWEGMDRLSVMCAQAAAAHRKAGGHPDFFVPPFTRQQIAVARRYATLVESHEAGGMKCANLAGGSGGGKGGDFMDAYLAEGREIEAMRSRLGDGQAMAVRRVRPSARGTKLGISDRRLVDMVCLDGLDLTAVLKAHGWDKQTKQLKALRAALSGALDRMAGMR